MAVAVYVRQSLDPSGLGAAVDRQLDEATALCRRENWDWVEYRDNDSSAYNLKKPRKDYQRMLQDIAEGKISRVVVWATDRLYRRLEDLIPLIDLLNTHNVKLDTVRGGPIDLTTPMGRTQARMMAVFSQHEMEQKSDRQKAMHRQRAKDGRNWWTHRPFGFIKPDSATDGSGATLHPVEAPLILEAYQKALAGVSLYSIMKEWNAAGVKTSRGYQWRDARLRDLLLNPRNAGLRDHNGEIVGEGDWPAIVSPEVFYAVKAVLTDPARNTAGPSRARKALLVGIAQCGKCGAKMKSAATRTGVAIYQCKECFGIGRTQAPLDEAICALIVYRLSQDDGLELVTESSRGDMSELRAELTALNERRKEAAAMYAKGTIPGGQLEDINMSIDNDIKIIESQIFDASRVEIFAGYREAYNGADEAISEWFHSRPLDQRRHIIDSLAEITFKLVPSRKPFTGGNPDEFISVEWKRPMS
ncbi:MAG: recombinase family protein [Mycolicibacterium neoaurum]|uniref:recombinase family protein n=1 Tax=Mycolicibacterium neoaurum TaxID=1795 RepID=UPI002FFD3C9D